MGRLGRICRANSVPNETSNSPAEDELDQLPLPGVNTRGVCTLLLLIHLSCLAVALSSNLTTSPLQGRLLEVFRPYLRTFDFDLNFAPYYLTHASDEDVDHHIEVLPEGRADEAGNWVRLGDGFRGGDSYKRHQRLAHLLAQHRGDDEMSARLARAVANDCVTQRGLRPRQLRCRKHYLQPWVEVSQGPPSRRDPNSSSYVRLVYSANILLGEDGEIDVVKIDSAREVAPPTNSSSTPKTKRAAAAGGR